MQRNKYKEKQRSTCSTIPSKCTCTLIINACHSSARKDIVTPYHFPLHIHLCTIYQLEHKYSLPLCIHYIQLLVHCLKPTSVNQHRFFLLFLKTQEVFCTLDNTISWMLVLFVSLRHVKWNHTILQFSLSHPPIWPDSIWSQLHHLCSKLMSLVLVCSVCCTSCSTLPVVCANKRIAFSVSSQWFSESVSCQTKIICRKYVELLLYKGRQTRKFFELKHPRLSLMHTTWFWHDCAPATTGSTHTCTGN